MANVCANSTNSLSKPIEIAVVGLGGFGENYLRALLENHHPSFSLIAGVDPEPNRCCRLEQLENLNIPIYSTLADLFEEHSPSLVLIASPAYKHKQQTCDSLANGCHVLCEKPLATTLDDGIAMFRAKQQAERVVAIGYQWSFSPAIQALKSDIIAGRLGRPKRLKSLVLWPRSESYYGRNSWAGRNHSGGGEPIFDSPVSNACAHHLHNMLYLLGTTPTQSEWPLSVACELYRAHHIESFDTAVLRVTTTCGAELVLVVSHATRSVREPTFHFEFENAVVDYDLAGEGCLIGRWNDGGVRRYGPLPSGTCVDKLWVVLNAIREDREVPCGIAASLPHLAVISAIQPSPIAPFPPSMIHTNSVSHQRDFTVVGLNQDLIRCYDAWALPSELGLDWSQPKHFCVPASWRRAGEPALGEANRKEQLV